jgi:formylmethanofuran dehydrogenase subunit E
MHLRDEATGLPEEPEGAMKLPEELERATHFHTHLGPYLVIGLRMGRVLTRELGEEPFSYSVTARTGKRPPYSCLVDGIQVSTPCTTGNGCLDVDAEKTMSVEARSGEGRTVVVTLRPEIYDSIERDCTRENQEEFALRIWEMPEDELLKIGTQA